MRSETTTPSSAMTIKYTFEFDDGHRQTHEVHLDEEALELCEEVDGDLPEWTRLDNKQDQHK